MALPWMESIRTLGASASTSASTTGQAPLRFGVLFAGNGFHSREWKAEGTGENMQLGRVLESLIPHRNHMHFIRGFTMPRPSRETFIVLKPATFFRVLHWLREEIFARVRAWIK